MNSAIERPGWNWTRFTAMTHPQGVGVEGDGWQMAAWASTPMLPPAPARLGVAAKRPGSTWRGQATQTIADFKMIRAWVGWPGSTPSQGVHVRPSILAPLPPSWIAAGMDVHGFEKSRNHVVGGDGCDEFGEFAHAE
jgi:hypothetical protein